MNSISEYQVALGHFLKTFGLLRTEIKEYTQNFVPRSMNRGIFNLWLHPKCIANIVQGLSLDYQSEETENVKLEDPQKEENHQLQLDLSSEESPSMDEFELKLRCKDMSSYDGNSNQFKFLHHEENGEEALNDEDKEYSKDYTRGPYKSYTLEQKDQAVKLYLKEGLPITQVSKYLKIPCKNIKRWATEGIRKKKSHKRLLSESIDMKTMEWIHQNFSIGEVIHMEEIQMYALSCSSDSNFQASKSWVMRLIERYKISEKYQLI